MESVQVSRTDLMGKIERNRARHIERYEVALVGWRKKLIASLSKALQKARKGVDPALVSLPKPMKYVEQYDRVLGMLRMSTEKTVELSVVDFDQFVRDKWSWSDAFANSTVGYARGAAGAMKKARRRA